MRKEKILIVEDEAVIAMTIEEALAEMGFEEVVIATTARTAKKEVYSGHFDLILMDINLNGIQDGVDLVKEFRTQGVKTPYIYISGNSDFKTVTRAKHTSPAGYLVKPIKEIDLMIMMELVFHQNVSKGKPESVNLFKLSKRENQILQLIIDGLSNKLIAAELFISEKTVSGHRVNIMKKVGAKNSAELVRMALTASN